MVGAGAAGADAINRVPTVRFWESAGQVERVPGLRLLVRVAILLSDSKNKDKHVVALHMIGHEDKSGKMSVKAVRVSHNILESPCYEKHK